MVVIARQRVIWAATAVRFLDGRMEQCSNLRRPAARSLSMIAFVLGVVLVAFGAVLMAVGRDATANASDEVGRIINSTTRPLGLFMVALGVFALLVWMVRLVT